VNQVNDTIARYEKMAEQFPQNELARFSLGKALYDAGEFARAKEHLSVALAKKPDWMVVQILIGKCDLALGDKASAKAAFERALQLAIEQHHEGPEAEMKQALAELD
jgi:tetratricopeptide (TPR) repeat protein